MDFIKNNAKTLAAFVATWVFNVVTSLINGQAAWPTTSQEWIQYLITSFGAAFAVYTARNKLQEKQVDKAVSKGDLPPETIKAVADAATPPPPPPPVKKSPISEEADKLDIIDQIIGEAGARY